MKRPLAAACFAYALTRFAASYLPHVAFKLLAAVFVLLLLIACCWHKSKSKIALCLICLAALAIQALAVIVPGQVFTLADKNVSMVVEVRKIGSGYFDGLSRADLLVKEINGRKLPVFRQFMVRCDRFDGYEVGERYSGEFSLKALEQNNYYFTNLSQKIYLSAQVNSMEYIGNSKGLYSCFAKLNKRISKGIQKYLPREEGTVLAAMSVGDKSALLPKVRDSYRRAGVSHLLVVSGLHLSLICGAFLGNKPIQGRKRKIKAFGAILLVLFVMGLTGGTPSIMRAGTAALIFYFGALFLLPADSFTSLGIAAAAAGFSGPYAYCNLGLQLSFMATLGVIIAAGCAAKLQQMLERRKIKHSEISGKLTGTVICPLFAALFTLPIQLMNSFSISGVSVLANLLITIWVGPALCLGLAAGIFSLIPGFDFAVRVFALSGGILVRLMNGIVAFCGNLPIAQIDIPQDFGLLVWASTALALAGLARHKAGFPYYALLCTILFSGILLYGSLWHGTVQVYPIGNGSVPCVLARENEKTILIFNGGSQNEKAVQKFLKEKQIDSVDLLVDLNSKPKPLNFAAHEKITAQKLAVNSEKSIRKYDIMTTVLHVNHTRLAVLDIYGLKISVGSGKFELSSPLVSDVIITGNKEVRNCTYQTLVTTAKPEKWKGQKENVFYSEEEGTITIRPRYSYKFSGGAYATG